MRCFWCQDFQRPECEWNPRAKPTGWDIAILWPAKSFCFLTPQIIFLDRSRNHWITVPLSNGVYSNVKNMIKCIQVFKEDGKHWIQKHNPSSHITCNIFCLYDWITEAIPDWTCHETQALAGAFCGQKLSDCSVSNPHIEAWRMVKILEKDLGGTFWSEATEKSDEEIQLTSTSGFSERGYMASSNGILKMSLYITWILLNSSILTYADFPPWFLHIFC